MSSSLFCAGNVPLCSSSWTINPILLCPWDLSDGLGREDFVEQALRAQGANLKAKPTSGNGIWNLVELLFFEKLFELSLLFCNTLIIMLSSYLTQKNSSSFNVIEISPNSLLTSVTGDLLLVVDLGEDVD